MHSVGALVYTGRCSTSAHSIISLHTPRDSQFHCNRPHTHKKKTLH